ncbi:MAG: tetratricopeptide repeat protein [bacterium]|nr:tetratricopeptide repeat protein [bacterium]
MKQKEICDVSSDIGTIYDKALLAASKSNFPYAIELLTLVLSKEPGLTTARSKLREIEKIYCKTGLLKKKFTALKINKIIKSGQLALLRRKNESALTLAEEALSIDVRNLSALKLLADAGKALDADFIAVEAYELAYSFYPKNIDVIKKLANLYRDAGRGIDELKLWHALTQMFPNNLEYKSEERSAAAMATMEKSKWEDKSASFRDKLKDKGESAILEQKEKIIHNVDDIKDIVISLKNKLNSEPGSIETIRKLGWLYYKGEEYTEALKYFKKLEDEHNIFDISINKALENCEISILNSKLDDLSGRNNSDLEVEKIKTHIINIRENYATKRANTYPNDLELQFDLAMANWNNNNIDSAIEHFQVSQNHLKWRLPSIIYLGRCFYNKQHYDLAIDQFKKAISLNDGVVDKYSLNAIYHLGITFEKIEDNENAFECFKQIYSVSSKYRDVADKVQKYYDQNK